MNTTMNSPNNPPMSHTTSPYELVKLVTAIIRFERLDTLAQTLNEFQSYGGITVTEVMGYGRSQVQKGYYRGTPCAQQWIRRVRLEILVDKDRVAEVIDLIRLVARTGHVGDGKIFVTDVDKAMRIRTGECGRAAL